MTEEEAMALAWKAIELAGGTRSIYRNPRQAFSAHSRRMVDVDGHKVEIRYGEISTPAVATVSLGVRDPRRGHRAADPPTEVKARVRSRNISITKIDDALFKTMP